MFHSILKGIPLNPMAHLHTLSGIIQHVEACYYKIFEMVNTNTKRFVGH